MHKPKVSSSLHVVARCFCKASEQQSCLCVLAYDFTPCLSQSAPPPPPRQLTQLIPLPFSPPFLTTAFRCLSVPALWTFGPLSQLPQEWVELQGPFQTRPFRDPKGFGMKQINTLREEGAGKENVTEGELQSDSCRSERSGGKSKHKIDHNRQGLPWEIQGKTW